MNFLLQSLLLLLSFGLVFAWQQSPLSGHTIQIIGFLVLVYIISSLTGKKLKQISLDGPLGIFVLNTVVLLFIFSTGGISSGFFFLLYFALFAIVFVFEPPAIVAFIVGAVLIFLPDALRDDVTGNFIKLGSLILISPLAFLLGKEHTKEDSDKNPQETKNQIEDSIDEIEENVEDVASGEKNNLKPESVKKLKNVIEKTEELREEIE